MQELNIEQMKEKEMRLRLVQSVLEMHSGKGADTDRIMKDVEKLWQFINN